VWCKQHSVLYAVSPLFYLINANYSGYLLSFQRLCDYFCMKFKNDIYTRICNRSDRQTMAAYGLDDVASKSHTNYDATEDPTVTNNFATVAFRFAHPMIQGKAEFKILL
jgi:hypothetical protein